MVCFIAADYHVDDIGLSGPVDEVGTGGVDESDFIAGSGSSLPVGGLDAEAVPETALFYNTVVFESITCGMIAGVFIVIAERKGFG